MYFHWLKAMIDQRTDARLTPQRSCNCIFNYLASTLVLHYSTPRTITGPWHVLLVLYKTWTRCKSNWNFRFDRELSFKIASIGGVLNKSKQHAIYPGTFIYINLHLQVLLFSFLSFLWISVLLSYLFKRIDHYD